MMVILNFLLGNLNASISVALVVGDLFCPFVWATIPSFFMFHDSVLSTHLKNTYHSHSLQTSFVQGKNLH